MSARPENLPTPVASEQHVDWDDLRLFLAIVRGGGIRGASKELALNPSTVSRRLASFERALETRLFERGPEGLSLTRAGEALAEGGERLRGDLSALCQRVAGADSRLEGVIRVTSAEAVGAYVARAVGKLIEAHPRVRIELTIADHVVAVERHEVDIAVRIADSPPEQLFGRKVGVISSQLYASRDYVRRLGDDLSDAWHSWIEWPLALKHKPAFVWLDRTYPNRRQIMHCSSTQSVLTAAKSGLGIAPLPSVVGNATPELLALWSFPSDCTTKVWVLSHRELRNSARTRLAMDALYAALEPQLRASV